MTPVEIARVCHDANRAYCLALGDRTQQPWDDAEHGQRESAVAGVVYALEHPEATPAQQHLAWCQDKADAGWTYGPAKDPQRKTHPCLIPYDQLPEAQRRKDALFLAVVRALA